MQIGQLQIAATQVDPGHPSAGKVCMPQLHISQVRLGEVHATQIYVRQIPLHRLLRGLPAAKHPNGGLHVRSALLEPRAPRLPADDLRHHGSAIRDRCEYPRGLTDPIGHPVGHAVKRPPMTWTF